MNFSADSVLFLFLFIFPGTFSKILKDKFAPGSKVLQEGKSSLTETSEIIVISMAVLLINLLILKLFKKFDFLSAKEFIGLFEQIQFLMGYICLTFISTMVFTIIFHFSNKNIMFRISNIYNEIFNKPLETPSRTVWESIFEGTDYIDIGNNSVVVAIEKDGVLIARGLISEYPQPNSNCNDILLQYCTEIDQIFLQDELREQSEKIFIKIDFEYCDFHKGVTFKFYNMDRYKEKCL